MVMPRIWMSQGDSPGASEEPGLGALAPWKEVLLSSERAAAKKRLDDKSLGVLEKELELEGHGVPWMGRHGEAPGG